MVQRDACGTARTRMVPNIILSCSLGSAIARTAARHAQTSCGKIIECSFDSLTHPLHGAFRAVRVLTHKIGSSSTFQTKRDKLKSWERVVVAVCTSGEDRLL